LSLEQVFEAGRWAFVLAAHSRRILGWRAASSMKAALVLGVLEQAMWTRTREGVADLSGGVSQRRRVATSIAFTERLAAAFVAPSVGTVGDALDALAEMHIRLFHDRADPSTWTEEGPRRRRAGHSGMGRLAQQPRTALK